ncbi:HD domain-containing protein [Kitasatospora aureofaciens]
MRDAVEPSPRPPAHVAACAGELWDRYLARPVRDRLVEALGAGDADTARRNAMFYAALHDLGKASACFQRPVRPHTASTPA